MEGISQFRAGYVRYGHCWLVSLARHVHDSTLARQGSLRVATKPHGVGDRRPTGYGGRGLVQCDFVGLVWVPRRF